MALDPRTLLDAMEAFPLHRQFGLEVVTAADGACHARCAVGPAHLNLGGVVHGGVMYLLLDVVAYCAALTVLPEGVNATTHDLHASILRPTPGGAALDLRATVRKAGRTLYFIDVEATVGDRLVASARVTKSVVPLPATPTRPLG
jgi:uncharacterized protein (TIGR00369 family)